MVNLLMISIISPLLVTYVIAVVSIYMGSQELPPISNNVNFCYLHCIFPKYNYSGSDSDIKLNVMENSLYSNSIKNLE